MTDHQTIYKAEEFIGWLVKQKDRSVNNILNKTKIGRRQVKWSIIEKRIEENLKNDKIRNKEDGINLKKKKHSEDSQ